MINLKITMIDGSDILIKNHNVGSAIEFVRLMLKPSGVPVGWIEVMNGAVININNIRSITEISEPEIEAAADRIQDDVVILPGEKENEEITSSGDKVEDGDKEKPIPEPTESA